MPTYRMVYGDDEQVVRQTFDGVEVEREDGWTVVFRGPEAILRVRDEHVQLLELLEERPGTDAGADSARPLAVRDIMRPAVMVVESTAHLAAATYLMKQAGDTALVVIDDDTRRVPIAVITDADIAQVIADGKNPNEVRLSQLVGRTPRTVSPETTLDDAVELLVEAQIRNLPVVDGTRLVGMVDILDACRAMIRARRGIPV
jgi:CBS domain-containing protein